MILISVHALEQSWTQDESTCFSSFNIFIDASSKGTYISSEAQNIENEYVNSTTPSPLDENEFQKLKKYNLLFDGNSGLRAEFTELESTNVPIQ